ncbi:MAG TPA: YqgE/AlgH family protein [Novosphingobium sp.]|nr:YqgE/AlgH family protein [Novosphingobium sp.]
MTTSAQYLAGRMLLALPGIGDPRFERAAIALCVHDEHGAFGLGLGEVIEGLSFRDLLDDLDIDPAMAPDCPVHHGGPVEPGRGFVLHSTDWGGEGTTEVAGIGALSASLDVLRAMAEGCGPSRFLIALGYAGWAAGQLDAEMRRHGWYAAGCHEQVLWDTPAPRRWAECWKAEGIDPALLSSQTGRA